MKDTVYGELTVRLQFEKNILKVQVINGRNLIGMDSNGINNHNFLAINTIEYCVFIGSSDPFVKICLLPEEKFTNIIKPKTQAHNKTQFPLYDETFLL